MPSLYAEPVAVLPFQPCHNLTHAGQIDWDPQSRRLTVTTCAQPWAYATEINLHDFRPDIPNTKLVVRIEIRAIAGEVGVGILGPTLNDLQSEVFVQPTGAPVFIDLPVSDPALWRSILIRNGSQPVVSIAEVRSVEIYCRPQQQIGGEEAVDGFLAACARESTEIVMFPPLAANLSPDSIRLIRIGGKDSLTRATLLHLAAAAATNGFAITANTKAHGIVLALQQSRMANLPANPQDWFAALLNQSEARYTETVQQQYLELSVALEESMQQGLSDAVHPAQECVIFELANACNLACPMCPRMGRKIKDGLMRPEDAKRIISDIASSSNRRFIFYPTYLGETMIHPAIFEIIDHALTFPNIEVQCISNGQLLDDRRIDELLKRPITTYNFSIHECDQAGQAGVRPDQALSTRNVLKFLNRACELGKRDSIFVIASMVPSSFTDPAVAAFRDYWLGVTNSTTFYAWVALDRSIPATDKISAPAGRRLPCTAPWAAPVVAYDGSVLPCCWDYEHSMVMGNLFEHSFEEIWSGEKFVSLREAILANDLSQYPTCANCEKWQQWVPGPPQVRLADYYYTSNGTYIMFGALQLDPALLRARIDALPPSPHWKHLPIYRKRQNWTAEAETA